MSEKALAIGAYVLFGVRSPVEATPEVTALISRGWEEKTGGKLEFVPDPEEMVQRPLAHIDYKRAGLGLTEYDLTRFGRSGDARLTDSFSLSTEEHVHQLYG